LLELNILSVDWVLRQQQAEHKHAAREQQLVTDSRTGTNIEDKGSSQQSQQLSSIPNGTDLGDSSSPKGLGNMLSNFRNKFTKPSSLPMLPTVRTPAEPPPIVNEATTKPHDPWYLTRKVLNGSLSKA
jgi:hypothetical protein